MTTLKGGRSTIFDKEDLKKEKKRKNGGEKERERQGRRMEVNIGQKQKDALLTV